MSKALDSVLNVREEFWDIPYLMGRYGVSRSTLTGTFFAYGIPKEKVGTKYLFLSTEVVLWEITCRYVPFGRKGRIVLPAFAEYSEKLYEEILRAKAEKDLSKVEQLRAEGQHYGIKSTGNWINSSWVNAAIGVLCALVLIAVLLEI